LIIKVKGYLTYKNVIGQCEIKQPDDARITLLDFICDLAFEIGGEHGRALFDSELGVIGKSVAIMLNGVHYNHLPERVNTVLKDLDEIAVFPPGVGG